MTCFFLILGGEKFNIKHYYFQENLLINPLVLDWRESSFSLSANQKVSPCLLLRCGISSRDWTQVSKFAWQMLLSLNHLSGPGGFYLDDQLFKGKIYFYLYACVCICFPWQPEDSVGFLWCHSYRQLWSTWLGSWKLSSSPIKEQ